MKFTLSAVLLAATVASPIAIGMTLSPGGTGQVLLFPYYTVNEQQQTLLSVTNTTSHGKALHLNFREGRNGRAVLSFDLFLSAHDTWVAALFALSDAGLPETGAAILVVDHSCTLPNIMTVGPKLPDGRTYQPFLNYAYIGDGLDTGPTSDERTREGYFEIIEMGEMIGNSLVAISPLNGVPATCAGLTDLPPSTDFVAPGGGLVGTEAIVNVPQGTLFTANAYAIDGFSSEPLYFPTGSVHPDLGDASVWQYGGLPAFVPINGAGGMVTLDYPPSQTIDAVSALLMADHVFADWDVSPGVQTDWVVTLPTKHFYVDPLEIGAGSSIPPFPSVFGGQGQSDVPFGCALFDRNGVQLGNSASTSGPACAGNLPYETQILSFSATSSVPPLSSAVLGSGLVSALLLNPSVYSAGRDVGTAVLDLSSENYQLRYSSNGYTMHGLPVIGFEAINYINANVTPGLLANYSGAYPLHATASCSYLFEACAWAQ